MKQKNTVEILFLTNSSFARRELASSGNASTNDGGNNSSEESLEAACWNGLLVEWLPEIVNADPDDHLFLWKINAANTFLSIELSEAPASIDYYFSLNPYSFLPSLNNN